MQTKTAASMKTPDTIPKTAMSTKGTPETVQQPGMSSKTKVQTPFNIKIRL